jgi:hypothetical protein
MDERLARKKFAGSSVSNADIFGSRSEKHQAGGPRNSFGAKGAIFGTEAGKATKIEDRRWRMARQLRTFSKHSFGNTFVNFARHGGARPGRRWV